MREQRSSSRSKRRLREASPRVHSGTRSLLRRNRSRSSRIRPETPSCATSTTAICREGSGSITFATKSWSSEAPARSVRAGPRPASRSARLTGLETDGQSQKTNSPRRRPAASCHRPKPRSLEGGSAQCGPPRCGRSFWVASEKTSRQSYSVAGVELVMTYRNPEPLVQTGWLEAHLGDPSVRVLEATSSSVLRRRSPVVRQ